MAGDNEPAAGMGTEEDVSTALARLMQRDLVFAMRFVGESQHLMQNHFQQFILKELATAGITPETHPMLHAFAEKHALMLRDFVFSGVSLSRQFRVEEIEQLTGDTMIGVVPVTTGVPVNSFWDIGSNDGTGIWLHQHIGGQNRFLR